MTLTQAAIATKKGIVIFVGVLILMGTAKVVFDISYSIYKSTRPPVEEKPDFKFGTLPDIQFPQNQILPTEYTYSLNTTTGGLPEGPKLTKIYFIPQTTISLLATERARKLAESLGFPTGPESLSPTSHQFSDNNNGSIVVDLPTGNFRYQRLVSTEAAGKLSIMPEANQIIESFKNYLSSKGLLPDSIRDGQVNVVFDGPSRSESQTATVSLKPSNIDKLPVLSSEFNHGLIKAVVTKSTLERDKFTKVEYTYWPVEITTFATYPLKTTTEAFEDLKAGRGFISLAPENQQVSITSVYLGYYQPLEYTPYLQPIIVFEGPEFAAYVPASKNAPPPTPAQ